MNEEKGGYNLIKHVTAVGVPPGSEAVFNVNGPSTENIIYVRSIITMSLNLDLFKLFLFFTRGYGYLYAIMRRC